MEQTQNDICQHIFLNHVSTLDENLQERYFDIVESLNFAIEISSVNKINFEFQNLYDFVDEVLYSDLNSVSKYWQEVLNNVQKK